MKTSTRKRTLILIFIAICMIFTGAVATLTVENTTDIHAYARGEEEILSQEETILTQSEQDEDQSTVMLSGGGRSSNMGIISGTDTPTLSVGDLTSVKYIPNANYFLINPWHHDNYTSTGLNAGGVCSQLHCKCLWAITIIIPIDA